MKIFQFKNILHLPLTLISRYSDNLKPRVNIVPPSANQCMKRAWYPRAPKSHHNNRIHSSCVAAMAVAEVHHPLKLHSPPPARRRYPWPHLFSLFDFFRGSQLIPPKNPLFWGRVAVSVMPGLPRGGGADLAACCNRGVVMRTTWTHRSWCGAVCPVLGGKWFKDYAQR